MNKRSKKIWSLITGLGMVLSMLTGNPLTAAEQKGSITVHKLKVEKQNDYDDLVGELTNRGTGNEITDGSLDKYAPFEGISFTLTKVKEKDGLTVENAETDSSFPAETLTTGENGIITFDELPLGTYKLEELDNAAVKVKMETVLIEVPTYNPEYKEDQSKQEWLYDVHVYPKNLIHQAGPAISKDVLVEGNNHGSVDIHTAFPWIITTDIPTDIQSAQGYMVVDRLSTQLDFSTDQDIKVIMRTKDHVETVLEKGSDFEFTSGEDNRTLIFDFHKGISRLADAADGEVIITFYTRLNDTAVLGTSIENKAKLIYTNQKGEEFHPESDVPEVHTGGVSIKKVDKADLNLVLAGAVFRIYENEADALAGTNPVMRDGAVYEVTSGADGLAVFYGLSYGETGINALNSTRDYWIVETKAPVKDGKQYNRLLHPFKVTVTATSHTQENAYIVKNASNHYDLPFTGGNGILLYIGGGILFLIAGGLLLKNTKKHNHNL